MVNVYSMYGLALTLAHDTQRVTLQMTRTYQPPRVPVPASIRTATLPIILLIVTSHVLVTEAQRS